MDNEVLSTILFHGTKFVFADADLYLLSTPQTSEQGFSKIGISIGGIAEF